MFFAMRFFKTTVCVFVIFLVVFTGIAFFHDDGTPDSLSDTQKQYVLNALDEYLVRMDEVIDAMEQFTMHPDQDDEKLAKLLVAMDNHRPMWTELVSNPVFFVAFDELTPVTKKLNEQGSQLGVAADKMAKKLDRRLTAGEATKEKYKQLETAFRSFPEINQTICDPSDCTLCKCKKWMSW